jgi:hypothetical protein
MLLKDKLTNAYKSKTTIVASYLTKITELRDQHVAIREQIDDSELVQITLNGFGPS